MLVLAATTQPLEELAIGAALRDLPAELEGVRAKMTARAAALVGVATERGDDNGTAELHGEITSRSVRCVGAAVHTSGVSDLQDYPLLEEQVREHLDEQPGHSTVEVRTFAGELTAVLCSCGRNFAVHRLD